MRDQKTSILGIGVDIEEIDRFKKLPLKKNKNFYERIFTPREIEYCLRMDNPYQRLAARFCAKEAVIKALAPSAKISYTSIEVVKKFGKPEIKIQGYDKLQIHTSLSHTAKYAIALIVIENHYERA